MDEARHVVAAGVVVHDGRVLLCRRRDDAAWYPSVWDLVGGHVEPGEEPRAALIRECWEELRIAVTHLRPIAVFAAADITLHAYVVLCWDGQPLNAAPQEHERVGWFRLADLASVVVADDRIVTLAARAIELAEELS